MDDVGVSEHSNVEETHEIAGGVFHFYPQRHLATRRLRGW